MLGEELAYKNLQHDIWPTRREMVRWKSDWS